MMLPLLNWWNGWRRDFDGWIVRARRPADPADLPSEFGFVEESAVAVREHWHARALDMGTLLPGVDLADIREAANALAAACAPIAALVADYEDHVLSTSDATVILGRIKRSTDGCEPPVVTFGDLRRIRDALPRRTPGN